MFNRNHNYNILFLVEATNVDAISRLNLENTNSERLLIHNAETGPICKKRKTHSSKIRGTSSASSRGEVEPEFKQKYPVSNEEILQFISKEKTIAYLQKIFNGEVKSERHNIVRNMFMSGNIDFSMRSKIYQLDRADFLEDDHEIDKQLFQAMSELLDTMNLSRVPSMIVDPDKSLIYQRIFNKEQYIWFVLIPETIVRYLQVKNCWSKSVAEKFYLDGESRVTDSELKDFDRELEEDVARLQRKSLEDAYASSEEEEGFDRYEERHMELPDVSLTNYNL